MRPAKTSLVSISNAVAVTASQADHRRVVGCIDTGIRASLWIAPLGVANRVHDLASATRRRFLDQLARRGDEAEGLDGAPVAVRAQQHG